MITNFKHFEGLSVTIHTNANCTCKCSYCYELGKPAAVSEDEAFWSRTKHADEERSYSPALKKCGPRVIDFEKVKTFLDQILDFPETKFFEEFITINEALVIDFIGGDSLQYPELLDKILTYLSRKLIERDHRWKYAWRCSISSNGVTLLDPAARKFCEKWKENISLGISIDGCPELHDLNRWCFADNADGSHRGSWQYIKEIWPWYQKTFPSDSRRTKWTLAPNSYKYIMDSVKFLHEELGMSHLLFNRVMEDNIRDEAEDLWGLIQQFEQLVDYIVEHHLDVYCSPFDFNESRNCTKADQLKKDPNFSRCGFGKMPTLSIDGLVYPCFRMVPGSNSLPDSSIYSQGTYEDMLKNEETLKSLNVNSRAVEMNNLEKCETCKLFAVCPHCAADCVKEDGTLTKTSSVCNFTRLRVYFGRKYWEKIKSLYPELYSRYEITWTQEDQTELIEQVLQDIVNLKEQKEKK